MATIHDVARAAGVSTATVSRVVNHPERVDPTTRRRVEDVILEYKYRPNQIARGLARKSSRTIGVVVNWFGPEYYGTMLDGAVAALRPLKYHAIAESSRQSPDGELQAHESLLARQCEAVILHSGLLDDDALAKLLKEHENTIVMNRRVPGFEDRCVYFDNREGGRKAAHYLIDKGHQRVAMVTGPTKFHETVERRDGFLHGLAEQGHSIPNDWIVESDFSVDGGVKAMEALLELPEQPSAVFFQNDEMVAGALETCRRRRMRVPEDISFLGFDGIQIAKLLSPQLSTVVQPLFDIGRTAALMAHALAKKQAMPKENSQRVFMPKVVERDSVMSLRKISEVSPIPTRALSRLPEPIGAHGT